MNILKCFIMVGVLGNTLSAVTAECEQARQATSTLFNQLQEKDTEFQTATARYTQEQQELETSSLKDDYRKNSALFFQEITQHFELATPGLSTYYRSFLEQDVAGLPADVRQAKLAAAGLTSEKYDELLALYNKTFKGDYVKKADAIAKAYEEAKSAMAKRVYENPAYKEAAQRERQTCKN